MAKQPCCFAAPQSGAAKSFAAFRHHIIVIDGQTGRVLLMIKNNVFSFAAGADLQRLRFLL
jgi:hypothetical protein